MLAYLNNGNNERISEEAFSAIFPCSENDDELVVEPELDQIISNLLISDPFVSGDCDYQERIEITTQPAELNELDKYLGPSYYQNRSSEHDNNCVLMNNVPVQTIVKEKQLRSNTRPIELSQSVAVGPAQKTTKTPHQISIVNELEEFYRPRYKSDYFAQNGKTRKPRYVADRKGNHFITLNVSCDAHGAIRVDWLTIPDRFGTRYSMPYKFQQNNELASVPDCNPLYLPINTDSLGNMKLYVVLIKAKQDELKSLRSLQPFPSSEDTFGRINKSKGKQMFSLNAKRLIQMYQLEKSQLAFTFCGLSPDRQSWIPEWNTTVYSTVLTELPPEKSNQKIIACPNCAHIFPVSTSTDDDTDDVQTRITNKRKPDEYDNEQVEQKVKIRKCASIIFE